jgi:hypothetical protein
MRRLQKIVINQQEAKGDEAITKNRYKSTRSERRSAFSYKLFII